MDRQVQKKLLILGKKLEPYPPFEDAVKNATHVLAETLSKQGIQVWVLAFSKTLHKPVKFTRLNGVKYVSVNTSLVPRPFRRLLPNRLLARILCLALGIKAVYMHGTYLDSPGKVVVHIYSHNFFQANLAIPNDVQLIAENASIREKAKAAYPAHRVAVLYPGVDLKRFRRKTRHLPGQPVRFLFASSPVPEHDTHEREMAILESRGIFDLFRITRGLGEVADVETVLLWRKDTALIDSLVPPNSRIQVIHQYIEDMSAYLEGFDFCFCLYRDDTYVKGIPQSMIECLAKGIPVITYRKGPLGELVIKYNLGITVDEKNNNRAIKCINDTIKQPIIYQQLSANAVNGARELFDVEKTASKIKDIYY